MDEGRDEFSTKNTTNSTGIVVKTWWSPMREGAHGNQRGGPVRELGDV